MSSRRPLSSYASFEEPPWFAHWSVITVAIVVASVVALYSYNSRERERVRIEQDRAAAQQAARAAEIVAKENSQQRALSTLSKQAAERQALIEARDRSYQDARREYESRVNDSYENRALYRAQMESRQNELRAEIERNRAQSDLERQKQWLEEERREEQYAAERRAAADYVERQRKLYEEYRSRQRPQGLLR